jgi:hypothetical protein
MKEQFTAVFEQVPEGYIAFVEELPGANTKGIRLKRLGLISKKLSNWSWHRTGRSLKRLCKTRL